MCRAHGGAARQVRYAAEVRALDATIRRGFNLAWARWRQEVTDWQVRRVLVTAELLDMPIRKVRPNDIMFCYLVNGSPNEAKPELRFDRRFGPRR